MWKYLNESVEGTSHQETGAPCQDASFVSPFFIDGDDPLILVCADGAGSAREAKTGATLACTAVTRSVTQFFEAGNGVKEIAETTLRAWVSAAQAALQAEADKLGMPIRELACTLLVAILGKEAAAFAQIGDGAMVIGDGGKYRPVFWPQSGEYQNTTFFVTEEQSAQRVQVSVASHAVEELAMFTDGLQMLALNYGDKTAHGPFFAPLFKTLREAADRQDLIVPLRQFLASPAVNNRTDDDKTLVLATRVQSVTAGL